MNYKKITIYTQVYNTKKYLRQCLDSVVNQTYPVYQYIVVDNGCTDGCSEIIKEYAEKFDFIEVIKHEENQRRFWHRIIAEKTTGDYVMTLDSDDWLELDCLEKAVSQLENDDYDIVAFGSRFCDENLKEFGLKKVEKTILMNQNDYHTYYTEYYNIFRTIWGKLLKKDLFLKSVGRYEKCDLLYGSDTYFAFCALRNAKNVLVLDDVLHNYVIHRNSVSNHYTKKHFDAIVLLYEDAFDFLSEYGEISEKNIEYINNTSMEECIVFMKVLTNCKLSADEKTAELLRFVSNDIVKTLLKKCVGRYVTLKNMIRAMLIENIRNVTIDSQKNLENLFNEFLKNLRNVFSFDLLPLFRNEPSILEAFVNDEKTKLLKLCFELIEDRKRYKKEYNLGNLISKLIPNYTCISDITEPEFFELYPDVCQLVLYNKNIDVLDKMTEILFSGNELNCPADFLNIYIKLAALENNVEAFLFGNIQKAYLFLDENRKDEAKQIVNELVEMGAGESEDVVALKEMLN